MKNRSILILITLFFCFCLNISYSNDMPYDIGKKGVIRDGEVLSAYIKKSVDNNERPYFNNLYEVQYAQELGLISRWTGEILYKPKINEVAEINEVETVERLGSETDAILCKPKVNEVAEISEAETVEKVDYSETDEILHKPRKKGCCCM